MKILPPITVPWSEKITRRHQPKPATGRYGYRAYVPCLRWEFGFSCAFCLVHEVDLSPSVGSSLMQVEHFELASEDEGKINLYSNCFHACEFCNQARGKRPNQDRQGRWLLNPCDSVWRDFFASSADELRVRVDNPDAEYTRDAYDFNDPRKVMMRRKRREAVEESLKLFREARALNERLLERGLRLIEAGDGEAAVECFNRSRELWRLFLLSSRQLEQFPATPGDAPLPCIGSDHWLTPLDSQALLI